MTDLTVELPAGGTLQLQSPEEVELWGRAYERYMDDYQLSRQNDLVLLGAILTQQLTMYRSQQQIADSEYGKPAEAQNRMLKAASEVRDLEKALGIDKKTREAGGQHTVSAYISTLKRAAHAKGIRIAERVTEMESLFMDMSWKIRLLRQGDDEDLREHGISETAIVNELEQRIDEIHDNDKKWAAEKGSVFVGKL